MNRFAPYHRILWRARLVLICVVFGALSLSVVFSLIYSSGDVLQESLENELAVVGFARELYEKTSLRVPEIAVMCTNNLMRTRIMDSASHARLPADIAYHLQQDGFVTLPYSLTDNPVTLFTLGDTLLEVRPRLSSSLLQRAFFRILATALSGFFFLSVLVAFAGGRITQPLSGLSRAMQRVAQGDFSVRLSVKKDNELGLLTKNFNRMVEELGSIEYIQKDFISSVSHEFKTPVATISGYAKLLQKMPSGEEVKEYTDIILAESRRLSRLSSNLLRLSGIEHQTVPGKLDCFSLDEQLRMAVVLLEPEWREKEIQWDLDLLDTKYTGEEELLNQVWLNLLSNAIRFSPCGGTISIRLYGTDPVKVKIRDKGEGMSLPVQERIFEKFYQGDPSRSGEGNGLGLAIVKRIIERSGGTVSVKSAPGEGAVFTVSLPQPQKASQP